MFQIDAQLVGMDVQTVEDHVVLVSVLGLQIPTGPNQAMAIPAVILKTPISRKDAIEWGEKLIAEAENLPEPTNKPDIVVASNLSGVDRAAQVDQGLRVS